MPIDLEHIKTDNYKNSDEMFVVDNISPLVVLFGPTASGKTMTLVRLIEYLERMHYRVVPELSFRQSYDAIREICHKGHAAPATTIQDTLLVKVFDRKGRTICQISDALGWDYFGIDNPKKERQTFIKNVECMNNKRIWLLFVEKGWNGHETKHLQSKEGSGLFLVEPERGSGKMRELYIEHINRLAKMASPKDKFIFVFSKVDKFVCRTKKEEEVTFLFREIKNEYPNIFTPFIKKYPLGLFKYNCQFVPFSSGNFYGTETGDCYYALGDEVYPKLLWKAILESVGK